MKIGIIGAGNIGATLARKLASAGHTILLANSREPDTIAGLARELGATAVTTHEAVQGVDVIITSIPFANNAYLRPVFAGAPKDAVVIDTSNYYPFRDGNIAAIDDGQVESLWVSEQFRRPIVKAWNAILAGSFATKGRPPGAEGRIALPIAGNDSRAKQVAIELMDATGFEGVDAGSLAESWRQQPGTPAYCTDMETDELRAALAAADRAEAPRRRELVIKHLIAVDFNISNDDFLQLNRSVNG